MMQIVRSIAVLALAGTAACWLQAQTPKPAADAPPQYPTVTLSFGKPQPTPLGGKGSVMLDNATCASDGTLFTKITAITPENISSLILSAIISPFTQTIPPEKMGRTLDSLTNGTEVVRYAVGMAPGYKSISGPNKYFATDNAVVTLVAAQPLSNSMAEEEKPKWVTLALVYDRKGTLERAVPIPPHIDPKSIGMYGSEDLLVITKDAATNRLRLLVLDHDGDVKNELSLFDYDYEANRKAGKGQPLAKIMDAADFIQIIPHGDNLLLVPQATAATVIEVNEQGIVRATDLQLPHGYLLRSLFPGDGPYWTVSTYDHAKIFHDKSSGQSYASLGNGPLFQFNSFDGSLVRRIDMPAKLRATLSCEHSGEFTALIMDEDTGHIEILTGSVPR
jgi:hypothetical protein